jgi:D-tyrosyl-tRNA(Tyr) deacylase
LSDPVLLVCLLALISPSVNISQFQKVQLLRVTTVMRIVIQRVKQARVEVGGQITSAIDTGLLVLLGIGKLDSGKDADYLVEKLLAIRIFPDGSGKMNRDIREAGGSLLIISQFTLYADCRKGRRPSFDLAAAPAEAERLYAYFVEQARKSGIPVQTGVFQALMQVYLVNDGPVTIICDSPVGRFSLRSMGDEL